MFFKLCCLAGKPWWGRRGTAAPLHHSALMCQALCLCVCVCASVCACVWCICVTRDSALPTGSQERATGLRERERVGGETERTGLHMLATQRDEVSVVQGGRRVWERFRCGCVRSLRQGSLVAVLLGGISFICDAAALPALSFYLFLSPLPSPLSSSSSSTRSHSRGKPESVEVLIRVVWSAQSRV